MDIAELLHLALDHGRFSFCHSSFPVPSADVGVSPIDSRRFRYPSIVARSLVIYALLSSEFGRPCIPSTGCSCTTPSADLSKKIITGLYAVLSLDVSPSSSRLVAGPRGVKLSRGARVGTRRVCLVEGRPAVELLSELKLDMRTGMSWTPGRPETRGRGSGRRRL